MNLSFRAALVLFVLCFSFSNSNAQLWRYLNHDPKADSLFEKSLDKEACSIVTKQAIVYSDTFYYPIRTYTVRTTEGTQEKVAIFEKPFSHKITIKCLDDSMEMEDVVGLVKVHFLSADLLEIVFSPRGGSDQGYDDAMVIGVEKGRFRIALALLSVSEYSFPDEYDLYEVRLHLKNAHAQNAHLVATVHVVFKSGKSPSTNFDRRSFYTLNFDPKRKIFFNQTEKLKGVFKFVQPSRTRVRKLSGDFPVIDLGKYKYYYWEGGWYVLADKGRGKFRVMYPAINLSPNTDTNKYHGNLSRS